jgi:hypothetical protein
MIVFEMKVFYSFFHHIGLKDKKGINLSSKVLWSSVFLAWFIDWDVFEL